LICFTRYNFPLIDLFLESQTQSFTVHAWPSYSYLLWCLYFWVGKTLFKQKTPLFSQKQELFKQTFEIDHAVF